MHRFTIARFCSCLISCGFLALGLCTSSQAGVPSDRDPGALTSSGLGETWGENLRFAWDVSSRVIENRTADATAYVNVVGIDFHKVFSGRKGDWGTLILQSYLTRIDGLGQAPRHFEDGNDWELVNRIMNFNYTGLSRGSFNIRLGHMEVPFGLEHVVNTNGTLHDYMHGPNIGVKADWGASVNGMVGDFEYEVALLRGTGIEYSDTGDPYLFAGRLGTRLDRPLSVGLSAYQGHVQHFGQPDSVLGRERLGVDAIWDLGAFSLMGEISAGDDEGRNVVNSIYEIDWSVREGVWNWFLQLQSTRSKPDDTWATTSNAFLGVRYVPDSRWALSTQWKRGVDGPEGGPRADVVMLQFRFRY